MKDLQELDRNIFQLMMAHKDNLYVEVKYFKDNEYHRIDGYIDSINYQERYIDVVDKLGYKEFTTIKFEDIIDVFII
ncbi:YolD-like family protein [Oceanobacillus jeddahense]|uniref:YolD-like family protein n=1 Tax=Oceanobacillus jeddahense TaxID=1462527 RepID=A0ABY5JN60_9BACI|nr:YolD-like family protein [Oceanobacillus jeddahense]UUI01728.1 YolD-like family protein [Oceanobacillus jeddahense]